MKEDGGVSVRAHVVEKRWLQNFGRENLRQETAWETQIWMGDDIKAIKTEQVGREWAGVTWFKISSHMNAVMNFGISEKATFL